MTAHGTSRIAGWLAGIAFVFALTLSATPQLHERLHDVTATHHCAVTLVSSGKCEHAFTAPQSCQPNFTQAARTIVVRTILQFARPADFSRLEHAPPAFA